MNRRIPLLLAGLAILPLSAGAIADGKAKPKRYYKSVAIGDNFYAPAKLTVKPNTKVTWRWPTVVGDTHDVRFYRGPKGVPHYQSEPAAADYSYGKLLTKLGTYKIICTFHEGEMQQTIVVRK